MGKKSLSKRYMKQLKNVSKEKRKLEQKLEEFNRLQRSECVHVNKHGQTWLEDLPDDGTGVAKVRCSKCGEILVRDQSMLTPNSVKVSSQVIKTVLSEIRSQEFLGHVKLDKATRRLIDNIDLSVLDDLPALITPVKKKKKDKKGKKGSAASAYAAWAKKKGKKDKKGKKKNKKNKRVRWNG